MARLYSIWVVKGRCTKAGVKKNNIYGDFFYTREEARKFRRKQRKETRNLLTVSKGNVTIDPVFDDSDFKGWAVLHKVKQHLFSKNKHEFFWTRKEARKTARYFKKYYEFDKNNIIVKHIGVNLNCEQV